MRENGRYFRRSSRTYLETGEPVGSRTISKYADLNLSSATIRNEMSDLEEMGYIIQPHTSAGRIPSDIGYRLYVDHLMEEKEQRGNGDEGADDREARIRWNMVLKQVAKVLAANTNYATMITGPQYHRTKLKFIQLSIVSEDQLSSGCCYVKATWSRIKSFASATRLDNETILKLNILLNTSLNGLTMEEINLGNDRQDERAGWHPQRGCKQRAGCSGRGDPDG